MGVSTDSSYNGNYSAKVIASLNDYTFLRIPYSFNLDYTYLFSVYCKNSIPNARIQIRNNNGDTIHFIILQQSNEFLEYQLEFTPSNNESLIVFWTYMQEGVLYVDNPTLTIV